MLYGSEYEVEIRGVMVKAVEEIKQALHLVGVNWSSVEVDWLLW